MSEIDNLSTHGISAYEQEINSEIISNSENTEPEVKTSKRQKSIPTSDNDTLAVIVSLLPKWDETILPLFWISKQRLQEITDNYSTLLMNRTTTGASRGSITSSLRRLDDEMDINIEHVKNRLAERLKSKQEAIARYREFGIVKEKSYKLPMSREDRVKALPMLLNALNEYQFLDTDFGIEYWTDMYARYEPLVNLARSTDGSVSSKVGTLNQYRSEVRKFQNCFIQIVKGNYPDTWKNMLRDFGFQKEKY